MMPVLFVSHGSPMLALEPGAWGDDLHQWASKQPRGKGILVVSAHWETAGEVRVTGSAEPGTLHDFSGFPRALNQVTYPVPGDPALAAQVTDLLMGAGVTARLDPTRPLDHGVWVPLRAAFPEASLPVVQVSLPHPRTPEGLFRLGQTLGMLRKEGILIVASGGVVHNLQLLDWQGAAAPQAWAEAFERWVMARVFAEDPAMRHSLITDHLQAPNAHLAVPTPEHLDPLFVAMGAAGEDPPHLIHRSWQLGSLSLGTWAWDAQGLGSGGPRQASLK